MLLSMTRSHDLQNKNHALIANNVLLTSSKNKEIMKINSMINPYPSGRAKKKRTKRKKKILS